MPVSIRPVRRRHAIAAAVGVYLGTAALASAGFVSLPAGGLVNDDVAKGIDPARNAGLVDVAGGNSAAGAVNAPWAAFEQETAGAQQVFVRAFKNGAWRTKSPGSLNLDPTKDAEGPSIDFAGPGRTVPWTAFYAPSDALPGGATNIFASRLNSAADIFLPSGQDRSAGQKVPSLNINTDREAENPALVGGAAVAGADPVPWVAWQEKDGAVLPAYQRDQIFVSRGVKGAEGQVNCDGFSPGDGPTVNGFCWQEVGVKRVGKNSLHLSGATDPSLNIDTSRDGVLPDFAFTGPSDTVPWVVWYEKGPSAKGLADNELVFAAKAIKDPAAPGGFRFTAVGRNGTGNLDASANGGLCATDINSERACSLNADPTKRGENPRIAAGTMTPGTPTAPWVTWHEELPSGKRGIFVARLVGGEKFVLINGGKPISPPGVDALNPDITFSGNTPYVTWREDGGNVHSAHFEGSAADPAFVWDDVVPASAGGLIDPRPSVASLCEANPFTGDGAACPADSVGTPFFATVDARTGPRNLLTKAYEPESVNTLAATGITATSAVANTQFNPAGARVRLYVEFGPTTAFGSRTAGQVVAPSRGIKNVAVPLTGLAAGTTVNFRTVVESDLGKFVGPNQSFVTTTVAGTPTAPPSKVTLTLRLGSFNKTIRARIGSPLSLKLRVSVSAGSTVKATLSRNAKTLRAVRVVRSQAGTFTLKLRLGTAHVGTYKVRLTARDPQGTTRTITKSIRIVAR